MLIYIKDFYCSNFGKKQKKSKKKITCHLSPGHNLTSVLQYISIFQ